MLSWNEILIKAKEISKFVKNLNTKQLPQLLMGIIYSFHENQINYKMVY